MVTFWAARASLVLFVWALALQSQRKWQLERRISSLALAAYLLHVVCAFQFFYRWSHSVALQETARQTELLFGLSWAGGLYLNYLLTLVWMADCAMTWIKAGGHASRPGWATWGVNAFLIFMFVNGSIVIWIVKAWRVSVAPVH